MKNIKMSEQEINDLYFVVDVICNKLVNESDASIKRIKKSNLCEENIESWIKTENENLMKKLDPLRTLQYKLEEKM